MLKIQKLALLAMVFILINIGIFFKVGSQIGGDSGRYLEGAQNLLSGLPLTGKQPSYRGYIFLLAALSKLGFGTTGVIVVQIIASALSLICLFKLGEKLSGEKAGWTALGLVGLNPEIQRWNFFILTDSLYISMSVICCWLVSSTCGALNPARKKLILGLGVMFMLWNAFLRPNGWVFLSVFSVFGFLSSVKTTKYRLLIGSIIGVVFLLLATRISAFHQGIQNEDPGKALKTGLILWGYPQWSLSMPPESALTIEWPSVFVYVIQHPLATARLVISRVVLELIHVRPFYSTRHNIAVILFLIPVYLSALRGFLVVRKINLARLMALIILGQCLVVAVTFADWDGRFLLYVFPFISVFSGVGCFKKSVGGLLTYDQ